MFKAKFIRIPLLIALISCLSLGVAEAKPKKHTKHKPRQSSSLVARSASYADIVIEAESGRILHSSSPDSLRHPASLTKMMTLYVVFQALENGRLSLGQSLPVSLNAAEQSPSKLGLRAGHTIKVEDAILGLVTESANDAAVVIAEALGGSSRGFGQLMTRQARALGMTKSRFDNPSGLPDPDQVTTARDMAMLGHALIYHFPQYYSYFSTENFTYAGINRHNHNRLMERYDGMDGIKTGYIRASGFNLVASATQGGTRLIGVVFGGRSATSRDNQMAQLLDQAFAQARGSRPSRIALAQGDTNDDGENSSYVKLPSKMVMLFPSRDMLSSSVQETPVIKAPKAVLTAPKSRVVTPLAEPTEEGEWGIQIGAYNDPEVGRQALANIVATVPKLSGADPIVQKVTSGSVTLFRARLMGLDKKTAQSTCTYLVRQGQSCLSISP
ncbi:MAG: D-alanyl-D-alanine carboxypeptidase family protein [Alphaproteobacteria bacterium]